MHSGGTKNLRARFLKRESLDGTTFWTDSLKEDSGYFSCGSGKGSWNRDADKRTLSFGTEALFLRRGNQKRDAANWEKKHWVHTSVSTWIVVRLFATELNAYLT